MLASLANNELYISDRGEGQEMTIWVDPEIWDKPAENLKNRRSLCSKVLGCWLFCQLWEGIETAKVLATEALVGAAKETTRGARAGESGGSSTG